MPSTTTIIASPQQLMPAYNPIKFIIDNSNVYEPGFRYIFSIYPAIGSHTTATLVAQYKVLPMFSTGYGEQDISMLMQSLVTWNFTAGQVNESWYQYDIDLGFEFIDSIHYTDPLTVSQSWVRIDYTAHGFIAGDQVIITQDDGGVQNPALEGLHTVTYANANSFIVNVLSSTINDINIDGIVTYADERKTQVLDDELLTDLEVFNGAYSIGIYAQGAFPSADYLGTTNPCFALTSLANPFTPSVTTTAASFNSGLFSIPQFYLMCRVYSGVNYEQTFYLTSNNSVLASFHFTTSDGLYNFTVIDALSNFSNDFYMEIVGDNGSELRYYFQYDDRCVINDQHLLYLDRMGSLQSFAFQLKTYEKGQITREQYNQHIDGYVSGSGEWEYGVIAMGNKTYNTNVTNTLDLNTNWMDQYNADRFQELLTSPQVFYLSPMGEYRACTIDATGFENFRQRNKNLIKQSVTIKLALNTPING